MYGWEIFIPLKLVKFIGREGSVGYIIPTRYLFFVCNFLQKYHELMSHVSKIAYYQTYSQIKRPPDFCALKG